MPYTPSVVRVNRLHILQRFHDYLGRYAANAAGRIRPAQHLPAVAGARLPGLCRIRRADRKKCFACSSSMTCQAAATYRLCRWIQIVLVMMNARWEMGDGSAWCATSKRRHLPRNGGGRAVGAARQHWPCGRYRHLLRDQVIYSVHFLEDGRIVGCREEELIDIDDPWTPSRFEFRDKVCPRVPLTLGGETLAQPARWARCCG